MKVIGMNGSPRKNNNSATLLKQALKGAESMGAETELINLIDLQFSGCRSCFECKRLGGESFGRCAVKDDLAPVLEKILNADAVIFSTPIYFREVPGMVRCLFERIWFPGNLYSKEKKTAYEKRVKVGLIYTMNLPSAASYESLMNGHKASFERFLGETQIMYATNTLQFDDYSLYSSDIFNEAERKQHHETQFPKDCEAAFRLGAGLADK